MFDIEKEMEAYQDSEEFIADCAAISNDYRLAEEPIPADEEIRARTLAGHRHFLQERLVCEQQGHAWQEEADGENGISYLSCDRCGESHTLQW